MKTILISCVLLFGTVLLNAQHTFSILAHDPFTGELGSAGASCADIAHDISLLIPGKSVVHAQAYVNPQILLQAETRINVGEDATAILNYLKNNDPDCNGCEELRQYGSITVANGGDQSVFTGSGILPNYPIPDYKGERSGLNYIIIGNSLSGPQILDSMEARFLNTTGSLAARLMSTLQGANVPGADERCLQYGTSSAAAFIRVAKPNDNKDSLYLELTITNDVENNPNPIFNEPIDDLQNQFDNWEQSQITGFNTGKSLNGLRIYPNPHVANSNLYIHAQSEIESAELYSFSGQKLGIQPCKNGNTITITSESGFSKGLIKVNYANGDYDLRKVM